jgi:probable O-glycosylation ligase (exosortase A-associated)
VLRSLYISLIYGAFLCSGLVAPFALGLGYVWVDTFSPQAVVYSILTEFPVSMVMAVATLVAYVFADRKSPPGVNGITLLVLAMAAWVTFTTMHDPVAPEAAWFKWNWAIKTIIFSAFMPFLFRSRVQIEAFLLIYIFSNMGQLLPFAAKTILSGGGGYGMNYGLVAGNAGMAEGSHLTTVAMMIVPVVLSLRRHSVILPPTNFNRAMMLGLAVACFPATYGTFERTGLVGMAVVVAGLWLSLRRRLLYGVIAGGMIALVLSIGVTANSAWFARMQTITAPTENASSHVRILVWRWTLDFVQSHPLGGGFNSFYINTITLPGTAEDPTPIVQHGRAFHSSYFEALGEHGWPGLALLLVLIGTCLYSLRATVRQARSLPGMEWCGDMAKALQLSLLVWVICAAFIGIAFQPEIWYMFALTVMLRHQVKMVVRQNQPLTETQSLDPETGLFEPTVA